MRLRGRSGLGRRRHLTLFAVMAALLMLIPAGALAKPPAPPVTIQFLNVSDWHGQIIPVSGVGGAAALAAYWEADRLANPNTLTLTAGDDFGATPPISTFFEDEPAVIAQRMMGMNVGTFGNHNFDRGISHLQQMIDLAGAPAGDELGTPFQYVAANLKNRDANLDDVSDWAIFDVGGIKVGVVGLVNEEAPTLVFPGSFGTIEITDSVRAANKARAEMQKAGAQIFVAITHKGIRGFDENNVAFGELIDFANSVGGFDLIFGDHTNLQYSGIHGKALVSMNVSKGLTYSKTTLSVDPRNGRVVSRNVSYVTPTVAGVTPDPDVSAYVADLQAALAPILGVQVANATKSVTRADQCGRADGRLCESLVGNIVTDALRASFPSIDFAITNSGGLRAALTCPSTDNPGDFCPAGLYPVPSGSGLWPITEGTVLDVLPFGNIAARVPVNGAELKAMLERGVSAMPGADGRFAQVSGLCFTYDIQQPVGSRVTGVVRANSNGTCSTTAVDLTAAASYAIVTNDFTASGGDGYPNFASRMTTGDIMAQAVSNWLSANSPINPFVLAAPNGRINCTDSDTSAAPACPTLTASPAVTP